MWLQKCPSKDDDYCYPYFKDGKVCDQCGPYKVRTGQLSVAR